MTTRIKATNTILGSKTEFENTIDEIASLQLKMDKDIAAFNDRRSQEDKEFKAAVKRHKDKINRRIISAESYLAHHREQTLGDKQSAETKLALFGYRKSPGIIKTLNSKWTLAKAVEALKAAGQKACVKVSESLNKNAVKSQIPEPELARYGLRLEFTEDFWVEPKREIETQEKRLKS